jgi:segregation and condensation protein B
MTLEELSLHLEALIFASDKPLSLLEISTIVTETYPEEELNSDIVSAAIDTLKEKYNSEFYSFRILEAGGGYQFLTKSTFHPTISKLNGDKYMKRLSTAALETLAIIAYRQPVTKSDCEYIRGVSCDYSIQKLLEKELIVISGRNEDAVGKPLLYNTSRSFMDYLGINSMDDLPKLREIVGEDIVIPTLGLDAQPDTQLVVNATGELQEVNLPEAETALEAESEDLNKKEAGNADSDSAQEEDKGDA